MRKFFKNTLVYLCTITTIFGVASIVYAGASESLNNDGATWKGGENSDGDLYSQLVDEKKDDIKYKITVWVKSDDGEKKEKTGTTNAVGKKGRVRVSKAATHKKPFKVEKSGYKNFECVAVNK